jgi:SagB-type dehydrogenase family enzyme
MLKIYIGLFLSLLLLSAGSSSARTVASVEEASGVGDTVSLPEPEIFGTVSVEEALSQRRSVRDFKSEDLELEEIAQLFWAAQGITAQNRWRGRTAPSAGALYPLQVYAVWRRQLWHYLPSIHALELRSTNLTQDGLADASLGQRAIKGAPASFILTGDYAVTAGKYGERAERYVHMEVGHAGQNLLLQAVALGLGAVPMGAFQDSEVKKLLSLPEEEQPLYIIPVGHRSS